MEEFLVLGASGYDFESENGQRLTGMNISYCDVSYRDDTHLKKGCLPMKSATTQTVFDKLDVLPGYYHLVQRLKPDGKGKAVIVVVDAIFSREFAETAK